MHQSTSIILILSDFVILRFTDGAYSIEKEIMKLTILLISATVLAGTACAMNHQTYDKIDIVNFIKTKENMYMVYDPSSKKESDLQVRFNAGVQRLIWNYFGTIRLMSMEDISINLSKLGANALLPLCIDRNNNIYVISNCLYKYFFILVPS